LQHTIRIHNAGGGLYSVTLDGRTIVNGSASPVKDAAHAILASSGRYGDTLKVVCADYSIADMTLGALTATRHRTLKSTADYQHHLARQSPLERRSCRRQRRIVRHTTESKPMSRISNPSAPVNAPQAPADGSILDPFRRDRLPISQHPALRPRPAPPKPAPKAR
jgi:hypothetical protein